MIKLWTSNYLQSQYSIFVDPKLMQTFQNGAFQAETAPYVRRTPSTLDQRSLTFNEQKKRYPQAQTVNPFERKWETHQHISQYWQLLILLLTVFIFTWNEEQHATLMRALSIRLFWNGVGEAHADPEWPEWFQKYHKWLFYPSWTANRIALSNQHRKVKICQSMPRFSRYTRSTYGVRKTTCATQMDVRT